MWQLNKKINKIRVSRVIRVIRVTGFSKKAKQKLGDKFRQKEYWILKPAANRVS